MQSGSELPEYVAPLLRNGGSQSPDRWLKEHRNNQTILGSFGIDEADAKARALAIGKELMHAEKPEKEEDEYGTIEDDKID